MMKRIGKTRHKCRQAFTLVELIIVLVILAVLAAILVPALIGYIKKANKEKYYDEAHYALVASQSVITEVYGLGLNPNDENSFITTKDKGNVYWYYEDKKPDSSKSAVWGDKVLALMDRERGKNEPYILIFGVGSSKPDNNKKVHTNETQWHTVYYLAYVANDKAPAVFYVNGEWSYTYPKIDDKSIIWEWTTGGFNYKNTIHRDKDGKKLPDNEKIPITFYVVSNQSKIDVVEANFWRDGNNPKTLKGHSEPYYKG